MLEFGFVLVTLDGPSESLNNAILANRSSSLTPQHREAYLHIVCFASQKRLLLATPHLMYRVLSPWLLQFPT